MKTAQDGGKAVRPTDRPPLPSRKYSSYSNDTSWDRTSDLPIAITDLNHSATAIYLVNKEIQWIFFINVYTFKMTSCEIEMYCLSKMNIEPQSSYF